MPCGLDHRSAERKYQDLLEVIEEQKRKEKDAERLAKAKEKKRERAEEYQRRKEEGLQRQQELKEKIEVLIFSTEIYLHTAGKNIEVGVTRYRIP